MMLLLAATLQTALPVAPPQTVYHGRQDQLSVQLPKRASADIRIDGNLDEPMWRDAALLTGFSQFNPVDGLAAEDSTEVLVWYSDHEIYIGVRAFEPHGAVRATLADRDRISSDDHMSFMLDTFNDRRQALWFLVNPLGVQGDGVYSETQRGDREDFSPDYLFHSKGRVTEYGYEIEVRIPFKSLRYQSARVQSWGLHVSRRVQHSGQDQTWVPGKRGETSFLAQAGTLQGLTELKRGLVLDLNPVTTAKYNGARISDEEFQYGDPDPELGLNLRWGVTTDLTMNGTINPDFSQVEADAGQINFDPRRSVSFPEKRPFFLEGNQLFNTPNRLVYTRRIVDPAGAVKFTGKLRDIDIGFLSAVDENEFSSTFVNGVSDGAHPLYNILRLRRNVGAQSSLGVTYTDKIDGDNYNRVASLDGRFVFKSQYALSLQAAGSFWKTGTTEARKPLWGVSFDRTGRRFNLNSSISGIHDRFVAGAGFISRPGIVNSNIRPSLTSYGKPDSRLQTHTISFMQDNTWDYQEFEEGAGPDDIKTNLSNSFVFRGGWRLGVDLLLETFRYPDRFYSNYRVVRTSIEGEVDTVAFTGRRRIPNYDVVINFGTPQWPRFSANGFIVGGRDENFEEWAPGYIFFLNGGVTWRPNDQARAQFTYVEQRTIRPGDRSVVRLSRIPRLKLEYQVSRPFFVRLVGQYLADERDTLRDFELNNGAPILVFNPRANTYSNGAFAVQSLRADVLFSYQPNPGTVIFAGYGSSSDDSDPFAFREVTRTSDGFFVKLSYLFRL